MLFLCEEAHRYAAADRSVGFGPTRRSISRIAKEGRKYGISLCLVTQRPAELDPTILSQCSTIFSFRLSNERDQDILKAGITDAARSLLEFMSTMGTGDAITFGEGVALPTRVKFDMLPAHAWPRSNTASFTEGWAREAPSETFLQDVVTRWRQQSFGAITFESEAVAPAPAAQVPEQVQRPVTPQRQTAAAYGASGPVPGQGQTSDLQGIGSRLRRTLPPLAPGEAPLAPSPQKSDPAGTQPSLSTLMKQFRA
jgi:hypothetical protein